MDAPNVQNAVSVLNTWAASGTITTTTIIIITKEIKSSNHEEVANMVDKDRIETEPGAQDARLSTVAVELLGMGVASRHHRRPLGDAHVGLP